MPKCCTTGSMLQSCKELESSLGLFSGIQGLFCGCLMHIQEQRDALPLPRARLMAGTKPVVKGEGGNTGVT